MRKLHDLLISLSQAQDVTIITRVHSITLNFCSCIILVAILEVANVVGEQIKNKYKNIIQNGK